MKNNRLLLLALSLLCIWPVRAHSSSVMTASDEIPLIPKPINGGIGNRAPLGIPIQCYYSEGELTFTFTATLGTVECEVVHYGTRTFVSSGTAYFTQQPNNTLLQPYVYYVT